MSRPGGQSGEGHPWPGRHGVAVSVHGGRLGAGPVRRRPCPGAAAAGPSGLRFPSPAGTLTSCTGARPRRTVTRLCACRDQRGHRPRPVDGALAPPRPGAPYRAQSPGRRNARLRRGTLRHRRRRRSSRRLAGRRFPRAPSRPRPRSTGPPGTGRAPSTPRSASLSAPCPAPRRRSSTSPSSSSTAPTSPSPPAARIWSTNSLARNSDAPAHRRLLAFTGRDLAA